MCIKMRVHVDLEWRALRDVLFFPDEESVQQEQKVVQVAGDIKCCPPLDEADVLGILSTKYHGHSKLTNGKLNAMNKTSPSGHR